MIIMVVAVLGVIFGSFVNALVWRLHEREELRAQLTELSSRKRFSVKRLNALSSRLQALSVWRGRSMCPHCDHELAAKDLVPVLSWLSLRGRCRYCGKPISRQYPAVELLTGLLFVASYLWWPLDFHGDGLFRLVVWLIFVIGFVAMAVYDLRWYILPDSIVYPLVLLATGETVVNALWTHDWTMLWQPLAGALLIFGLFWILYQVSKGAWIGGGDVKLALVLGLLAGSPGQAFLVIFIASLLGTLGSVPMLVKGREGLKVRIPFGPYLLSATVIAVLFGAGIVSWYQHLLQ